MTAGGGAWWSNLLVTSAVCELDPYTHVLRCVDVCVGISIPAMVLVHILYERLDAWLSGPPLRSLRYHWDVTPKVLADGEGLLGLTQVAVGPDVFEFCVIFVFVNLFKSLV